MRAGLAQYNKYIYFSDLHRIVCLYVYSAHMIYVTLRKNKENPESCISIKSEYALLKI